MLGRFFQENEASFKNIGGLNCQNVKNELSGLIYVTSYKKVDLLCDHNM